MKTIAFVKSTKKHESRIAILPHHLEDLTNPTQVMIESGYALHFGISDDDYAKKGAKIETDRRVLLQADIIVDPKIGDATYLVDLPQNRILFGYFHAVQNRGLVDQLIQKKSTCFAWEDMYEEGYHTFSDNNVLAGYASVMHASINWGRIFENKKVAVIGRGNTAIGAINALSKLGANIEVFTRRTENKLKNNLEHYDIIVNAVMWDIMRDDYIISREDLSRMKKHSLIIDISCDIDGAIETSVPATMDQPIKRIENVYHYSLSNSPSVFAYDASNSFGNQIVEYIDLLIKGKTNKVLDESLIINAGVIVDERINIYQSR